LAGRIPGTQRVSNGLFASRRLGGRATKTTEVVNMKKIILASVLSTFAFGASAAYACDGMKGHAKGDKTDQSDTQSKKDTKDTKSDTKS
jgi:hypothetical protein